MSTVLLLASLNFDLMTALETITTDLSIADRSFFGLLVELGSALSKLFATSLTSLEPFSSDDNFW